MNYKAIKNPDIANGEGIRVSLFVSGCRHACKNCFNEEAWSFQAGEPYEEQTEKNLLKALEPSYIAGLSILGGEPFEPENQTEVCQLLKSVKEMYPDKTVWIYSGFTYEELSGERPSRARTECTDEILEGADILVDGPFVEELKNIALPFRGSENQRIIDLKKTRDSDQIILYPIDSMR